MTTMAVANEVGSGTSGGCYGGGGGAGGGGGGDGGGGCVWL